LRNRPTRPGGRVCIWRRDWAGSFRPSLHGGPAQRRHICLERRAAWIPIGPGDGRLRPANRRSSRTATRLPCGRGLSPGSDAAAAAVAVLLAGLIFLMIARRLIRPLEGLAASAEAIARGERPSLPEVKGPAEVVQLTAGMRVMSQAVANREDALRFLAEASRELSSSLDDEAILRNLSHLAVPRMADWCVIYLVHEDGTVRRLEIAHADPAKLSLVRR